MNISSRGLDRLVGDGAAPRRCRFGWRKRQRIHKGGTVPAPLPANPSILLGHIPTIPALSGMLRSVFHHAYVQHCSFNPFLALFFGNILAFIIPLFPTEVSA